MTDSLLKETAGESLQGAIDGSNTVYEVSFDYNADTVNIYVNGRLKIRDWDDGFWVIPPRTVKLKEPLQYGDSLEVEYKSNVLSGGGAEGGCPNPPRVVETLPGMSAAQNLPEMGADEVQPGMTAEDAPTSRIAALNLRPAILPNDSSDGGC